MTCEGGGFDQKGGKLGDQEEAQAESRRAGKELVSSI